MEFSDDVNPDDQYFSQSWGYQDDDNDFRQKALESKASFDENYCQLLHETINELDFSTNFNFHTSSSIPKITKAAPKNLDFINAPEDTNEIPNILLLELRNYLQIRIQKDIEKVEEISDKYPLLELRKAIMRIAKGYSELCSIIISTPLFDVVVILVIIFNTVILTMEDPSTNSQPYPFPDIELFFTIFYSLECGLKISSLGLILNQDAYLRDWWNVLDFVIIFTAWLDTTAGSGFKLSALRSLRVLRPLRGISSISGMRAIIMALINSIKPLLSALVVLFFFTLVFAIGALQLWMGVLKQRCLDFHSGIISDNVCGSDSCGSGFVCAQTLDNPNYGVTHFDNIFVSFITVFQIVTMEGWTNIMIYTQEAFSYWSFLYYIPLIFIAGNLILNLTLAIITSTFKEVSVLLIEQSRNENVLVDEDILERIYKNTTTLSKKHKLETTKKIRTYETELNASKKIKFDTNIMNIEKTSRKCEQELEVEDFSFEFWGRPKVLKKDLVDEVDSPQIEREFVRDFNEETHKMMTLGGKVLLNNKTLARGFQSVSTLHKRVSFCPITEEELPNLKKTVTCTKLKQAVTVKEKTLKALKNNPNSIKKSRLELIESYVITSDSITEIIQAKDDLFMDYQEFKYIDSDQKLSNLMVFEERVNELKVKFPEFNNEFHLFLDFSNRKGKKIAFYTLKVNVKRIIKEICANEEMLLGEWSAKDVAASVNFDKSYLEKYSYMNFRLWSTGKMGYWEKISNPVKTLVVYKHTNTVIILVVIMNTTCLAYDHYGISKKSENDLQMINVAFTYFFVCELVLKIIGLGFRTYLRDFMNYFDLIVVTLSLIEIFIISGGSSAISAFRAIRVFRIFRVLKVVKILRYLKSLESIVKLIGNSISSLGYLFLLLLLFLFIFTLLGMQIFGGAFNFPEGLPRGNFDSFHWAFITIFQVLTTENWNDILTSSLRSNLGIWSSSFLILWIVIGNFIILNLFLAILLDSVGNYKEDKDEPIEEVGKIKNNILQMRLDSIEQFHDSDSNIEQLRNNTIEEVFKGIECQKSYYLFKKNNFLRLFCMKLCKSQILDNFILVVIALNSCKLVWDTYILDSPDESMQVIVSDVLDIIFTSIFTVEFFIKSIAFGLIKDRMCYLQDNWNKVDLVIVILSIIDLSINSINLPVIKVFRLLRTLRPLRLINHNLSMKVAVSALIDSMIAICNVLVVIFVVWLVFAILGVSLLSGKMHYCEVELIESKSDCEDLGYTWLNSDLNFDNVLEAMVTLFIVMSQESWPNRMYEGVDARSTHESPLINYNPYIAYYYVIFVIIGNFFMVNLFTVIVFSKFNEAKSKETSFTTLILSKKQILWSEIQQLIIKAKPEFNHRNDSLNKFQSLMYRISKNPKFDIAIMVVILINMLILAMPYNEANTEYMTTIENLNIICTYIFILETLIKIAGLGTHYFKSLWNCFDFIIVSASVVDVSIVYSGSSSNPLLRQGPQLVRVVRVLRISRLLRLAKGLESLKKLIMIITYALPAILNVLSLLLLVFFIYAILGVFLFYKVKNGVIIDDYFNFSNFHSAMTVLWRISTGEDYPSIMSDCTEYLNSKVYIIYYLSFVIVIDFVVLELFVSIIIQHYDEFSNNPKNALNIFTQDFKIFKRCWLKFTLGKDHFRIHKVSVVEFMQIATKELKILPVGQNIDFIMFIGTMNIPIDSEGYFYFNDVLYALFKKKFAVTKRKKHSKMLKFIRKEEHQVKIKLKKIREKYLKDKKMVEQEKSLFFNSLFLKNLLKKWRNYTKLQKLGQISDYSDNQFPGANSNNISNSM